MYLSTTHEEDVGIANPGNREKRLSHWLSLLESRSLIRIRQGIESCRTMDRCLRTCGSYSKADGYERTIMVIANPETSVHRIIDTAVSIVLIEPLNLEDVLEILILKRK